jgi:tetratricopeptide (TPR) repeat protein
MIQRLMVRHPVIRNRDTRRGKSNDVAISSTALLNVALDHHRAGRLADAMAGYDRLLALSPDHFDALHLSGFLAHQAGRSLDGLRRIHRAILVHPVFPEAFNSLGSALADLGRNAEAEAAFAQAIKQRDDYAEAHGNLGTVFQAMGRMTEAEEAYGRALAFAPHHVNSAFNLGILYRQTGRIAQAAHRFYDLVTAHPQHAGGWRNLALCLRGLEHPDAEACLVRALQDFPKDAELSAELGHVLLGQGRLVEAVAVLEPAAFATPDSALLHFALAAAFQGQNRLSDAVDHYRIALGCDSTLTGAWNNLGVALLDLGRRNEALPVLRVAVAWQPDDALVLNNAGTLLDGLQRLDEAAILYTRALRLRPDYGKALNNLGGVFKAWKWLDRAEALRRVAIAAQPDHAEAYANLASVFEERDNMSEAERLCRRGLRLNPTNPDALTGYGLVLQVQGKVAEAEAAHRKALSIDNQHAEARANLGMLFWQHFNNASDAESHLSYAIDRDPTLGPAHLNRGIIRLTQGRLTEGWDDYQWRFRAKGYEDRRISAPRWQGEILSGQRLLVWPEQGVGDEILFSSCWPDLIERVGHLVIECDHRLVSLFARSFPQATVRARSVGSDGQERITPSGVDAQIPAGDVPRLLRQDLTPFVASRPWLIPDPQRVALWRDRVAALGSGVKVGIGWRSQMMTTDRRAAYTRLDQWGAIFAIPGLIFVNVQYGDCAEELDAAERRFGVRIHRWDDLNLKDDFDGAAALTVNLDLVISPAMSAGELAGALGTPVWRFGGRDWTQLGTAVRPWFPTMRLFQPMPGEGLDATLTRMALALRQVQAEPAKPSAANVQAIDEAVGDAIAAYRLGDVAGADARVSAILAKAPNHGVALHLAGVLAARLGDDVAAETRFALAVRSNPLNAAAHAGRAEALQRLGMDMKALAALRAAVMAQPDVGEHLVNLTALLRRLGQHDAALSVVRRAIRLRPDLMLAHTHLGSLTDDPRQTLLCHRRAVALAPGHGDALNNLGGALYGIDRFGEAERVLGWAIRILPTMAVAWTGRGNALDALGRVGEAARCHRIAMANQPDLAEAHANLAFHCQRLSQRDAALAAYRRALLSDPRHGQAHYNRGLLLLERGELRQGWAEHEWRFATPQQRHHRRRMTARVWRGENIAQARLLVWREQGVGDEILFSSCYGELAKRAGRLVIECDRRLAPLFARSFPTATVRAETVEPRDVDVQIAAGSAPRLLRSDLKRFPLASSWLTPDPKRVAVWRDRLEALGPGLKIGIGWRSQIVTAQRQGAYTALDQWDAIFAIPGITFINLQYGECADEIQAAERRFGVTIHRWPDLNLKDDFDGVAALMVNLDLVLSPAMSAGELAGALGAPVWRFCGPDWTQLGSAVRPWFPTMRVFHPRHGADLTDALNQIAGALRGLLQPIAAPPSGDDLDDLLRQAVDAHRIGASEEAASLYERVLDRDSANIVALHLSGLLAHQMGESARGEARIAAAVAALPEYAAAQVSLGMARLALGAAGDAIACFRKALALQPDDAATLSNLGNALAGMNALLLSEMAHRRAVFANPSMPEAHDNHGVVLARLGRLAEAWQAHRQALRLAPALVSGWVNRSIVGRRLARHGLADRAGQTALTLQPALADAMANRGRFLREQGQVGAALRWCDRALAVQAGLPAAAFNGGILRLAAGGLNAGWWGYDQRFEADALNGAARRPGVPVWRGEALAERRILVWREQGIGDEVMFANCLPSLIAEAKHVTLECDPRFRTLFARSFPNATVIPAPESMDQRVEGVDCHAAVGSLPRYLRRNLGDFPPSPAFLRADDSAVARWRQRLAALGGGLLVGVAWRSSQLDAERMPDYTRLEDWAAVFAVPGVTFINLQYGDCAAELESARRSFSRAPHVLADLNLKDDLDESAALMTALDLVIAPAISTGELAGAVGTPVWRIARDGDWTTLGAAVRPWFPAMRVFRCAPGQTVADQLPLVAAALRRLATMA